MADRNEKQPELWSARDKDTQPPRPVLPYDLATSLRHLPDEDLTRLSEAITAERQRRGIQATPARLAQKMRSRKASADSSGRMAEDAGVPLTASQINLIRSSIKAGVKPSVLSRQFGISRAQIRAALEGA